ncbi:MAG: sigma 54-interacting transcriptional regulator [Bacteroidota bacterium]
MLKQKSQIPNIIFSANDILQGMPELAYVFDDVGRIIMWNKNVEVVLGYSSDELFHKPLSEFIDKPDLENTVNEIKIIFEEKTSRTVEYNLLTKIGKKIPYIGSGSYAFVEGEEYFIGQAINISKLKDAEKELDTQLAEINKLKDLLEAENIYLRQEMKSKHDFDDIIGESETLMHSLYRIDQVAKMDSTVLLEGETGTGKELFAMAIHSKSNRKNKSFVKVNCASLPASLIESELFGHEKGAYTGAVNRQIGRFELAHKGSIFLDEIGELPIEIQSKLLRVLQEGEFERIGSPKTIKVDVRIIAATNRNLEEMISKKLFRKDLYYRLNVYPITIAPLRDRITDIPLLVEHFVEHFNLKMGKKVNSISKKTINQLKAYSWPGNIRELENIVERAIIISPSRSLVVEQLQKPNFGKSDDLLPLAEYERRYIIKVLEKTYWRVDGTDGAAKILEMHPETLRSRMRKLEISRPNI